MSREARALRWIVGLLEELEVPFQVVGGLAAGAIAYKRALDREVDRQDLREILRHREPREETR